MTRYLVIVAVLVSLVASAAAEQPSAFEVVRDLVARATSTSEVLTLNLTNLLILLVLKALIFGLGLFGSGSFGGFGRSADGSQAPMITRDDMLLMLTFLKGDMDRDYGCLNKMVCEEPSLAKPYLFGGKLMLKGATFMKKFFRINEKYEKILFGVQDAVETKLMHGSCERYLCGKQ